MTISRYDEHTAATFNAQLQSLEDLYVNTGNAMELITLGTLTSDAVSISMTVTGATWAFLRLRIMAITQGGAGNYILLTANENFSTTSVYYCTMTGVAVAGTYATTTSGRILAGYVDSTLTNPCFSDMIIFPTSLGFSVIGSSSTMDPGVTGLLLHNYSGFFTGGAVTSLQIRAYSAPTYLMKANTTYRLEGFRA